MNMHLCISTDKKTMKKNILGKAMNTEDRIIWIYNMNVYQKNTDSGSILKKEIEERKRGISVW